jgi:hypothetical protein
VAIERPRRKHHNTPHVSIQNHIYKYTQRKQIKLNSIQNRFNAPSSSSNQYLLGTDPELSRLAGMNNVLQPKAHKQEDSRKAYCEELAYPYAKNLDLVLN